MNEVWSGILNSALLGTDKRPFDIEDLPEPLKSEIKNYDHLTNEQKLLTTSTLFLYYKYAGACPQKFDGDLHFEPIIEFKQVIVEDSIKILYRIFETGYYEKEYLLNLWLDKLIDKNNIVDPNQIVPLIRSGANMTKSTRKKICNVIGQRGNMILPLIQEFVIPPSSLNQIKEWKEGSQEERKNFFIELRNSNQAEALSIVRSDWDTENVIFKKSLIEIFADQTNEAEYQFLNNLYSGEFTAKHKEKKTETECRYLLASTLMKNPLSELYKSTSNKLKNYKGEEKKSGLMSFLSSSKDNVIKLPNNQDSFFNGENMLNTFGIDPKNPDPALYPTDVLYWFSELLAIFPISGICELIDKKLIDTFNYLTSHKDFIVKIEGKDVSILLNSLVKNVSIFKDQNLLFLVLSKDQQPNKYELLQYTDIKEFESYIIKEKLYLEAQAIQYHPAEYQDWSESFSIKILDFTYNSLVVSKNHYNDKINHKMIKQLHVSSLYRLEELYQSDVSDNFKDYWIKNVYQPLKTSIEIKLSISKL